jgi:cell division septation protein DedD
MRRIRSDVSHRVRRQPSIFGAAWFRGLLGAGLVMIVALLVAPSVAGWFGSELPQSLFPLLPWAGPVQSASAPASRTVSASGVAEPRGAAAESRDASSHALAAAQPAAGGSAATRVPAPTREGDTVVGAGQARSAPTGAGGGNGRPAAPASPPPRAAGAGPDPGSERLAAPPVVYWVQVGAFLDHGNAERLVERLRGDGLPVGTTTFEQSRVVYRVLLTDAAGAGAPAELLERARGAGLTVEATPDGPAVSELVPLRRAVEISRTLRQQGVPVRLKQNASSATYRVVRVGSYRTSAEAEATLAALAARGVEGLVVRER